MRDILRLMAATCFVSCLYTGNIYSAKITGGAGSDKSTLSGSQVMAAGPAEGRTFVINISITDLDQFRELVRSAEPLKSFGHVRVSISTLADKSFYEIPPGGNPWNEYASNNPALYKFFPDPRIAPFVPADFVAKNKKLLLEKAKILGENGMDAAFFGNEPAFLPPAFFEAYPGLRGPRVDHPRRSRVACFSPCLSMKEMQEMYSGMMAEMLRNAPLIKTFYFKTNDAGSGNCWSEWLYSGPNGPDHCRAETTGQRIAELMKAMQAGAAGSGNTLDVYLSHPQGSSNFSDPERADIQNRLPAHCYFKSTPEHEIISLGSEMGALYPVKGICDVISYLNDLDRVDIQKPQTIFINFSSYYGRGDESAAIEKLLLGMLADHFGVARAGDEKASQRAYEYCRAWAGEKYADTLYHALTDLHQAFDIRRAKFGNLAGIYWDVSSRMINRPLVAAPQRLSEAEEAYFLPFVFNVSEKEARMDYLDIHGGRWTLPVESVRTYVDMIKKVCAKLESMDLMATKTDFIREMALALRVHASLVRSCANFTEAQGIRDVDAEKLNGPVHRPGKESTWTGDPDLLKFNAVMRDELDNTAELAVVLEHGGLDVLCHATDNAHEDCFLLGPDILGQLKLKYRIMLDHWRDIEDYMTTPFK